MARLFQGDIKPRTPDAAALSAGQAWAAAPVAGRYRGDGHDPAGVTDDGYWDDGYRDDGRIARRRVRRPGWGLAQAGLFGGALIAALMLFFAGFLAAYLLFTDAGYPVAVAPVTQEPAPERATPTPTAPDNGPARAFADGLARPAQALSATDALPAPAPEIQAAQQARRQALDGAAGVDIPAGIAAVDPSIFAEGTLTPVENGAAQAETAPRARLKPEAPPRRAGSGDGPTPVVVPTARVIPGAAGATERPVDLTAENELANLGTTIVATGAPFSLQFGAFSRLANAERLRAQLFGAVADVRIEIGSGADGVPLHYVRSGGFETRLDAERRIARLRRDHGIVGIVHVNLLDG